jgi:hypothetical protein
MRLVRISTVAFSPNALSDISDCHEYTKGHDVTLMLILLPDSITVNLFTIREVHQFGANGHMPSISRLQRRATPYIH